MHVIRGGNTGVSWHDALPYLLCNVIAWFDRQRPEQNDISQKTFSNAFSWKGVCIFFKGYLIEIFLGGPTLDKSSTVLLMAWHHTEGSHFLNQWLPNHMTRYGVSKLQSIDCYKTGLHISDTLCMSRFYMLFASIIQIIMNTKTAKPST